MSHIKDVEITHNDDATITITGEIPFAELTKHRAAAIAHLGKDVQLDGFRKGNIPESVLVEKIGDMAVLSEMAERALAKAYPEIITTHEIDAIGYPQVSITKLAADNPLGFQATVAVIPTFSLPDYKEIAKTHTKDVQETEVTDDDIAVATKDILRRKVAYERLQQKAAAKAQDGDLPTPETVHAEDTPAEPTDAELPELTDEVAKTLGNFTTVAEFHDKLREELSTQKKQEAQNKHRALITDALVEATEITVPAVLVNSEIEQFLAQMRDDLKRAQLTMEEYLSHIKKTEEELKNEWKPAAEKRAKVQLILDAVAKAEEIVPDETIVANQVAALKQQYPDADEARVTTYVSSILRNEAVMKLLEGDKANETDSKKSDSKETK